jgi:hypothetical protein
MERTEQIGKLLGTFQKEDLTRKDLEHLQDEDGFDPDLNAVLSQAILCIDQHTKPEVMQTLIEALKTAKSADDIIKAIQKINDDLLTPPTPTAP